MECDVDNLMYEDTNNLMLLHSSFSIRSFVEQELNWFNSPKLQPYCIKSENIPNRDSISHFKSYLWDFQNNLDVVGMNRSPGHLAKLCCNRCLSSDHILKFVGMLSSPNCQAVYINYVQNLQNLIDRLKTFSPLPIKLIFFVNVKTRDKGVTLLGPDNNPGNHWTMTLALSMKLFMVTH